VRQPALADLLAMELTVAEADQVGALSVFPLIADRSPAFRYMAFAEARKHGVEIKELAGAAQVGDLVVHNPLELPVLFYEGEEVHGAQQDRTVDISVLVAARSTQRVPVCCVEQGRWDSRRHAEPFAPAPHTAYPELRRLKNEQVRARQAAGAEPRAAQGQVWQEIAAKSARLGAHSRTGALRDVFDHRRGMVDRVHAEIEMKCSQVGMLAAIGGRFVVLDYASDVEAFAALHDRLLAGYALDALEPELDGARTPSLEDARDFLALLLGVTTQRTDAVGLGSALHFEFGELAGTALAADDELVTITAFAAKGH
jgi:hypothetical protein